MRRIFTLFVALFVVATADAQEPFNGRITNIEGKGIKARIVVKDSDKRTFSDGKGRFGLTDIEADDVLMIISRRDTMTIPVEGRKSIDIVWLREGESFSFRAEESEELMNYGFGYVKRRESSDYSSGISGDRLRATGAKSLVDAIQMCYPGLRYINGELCLLTQNSISSSSSPLILCDGMETNLDLISLYDVKSVEIIKGSNMYGFRGVNGVILITTMDAKEALNKSR
ncbi:MAG: TonB-dependent receptor plug domain-containing protein [Alistipes sp.]|nr:TonB-dependent receptor plug domain-containing protein [Alistipes sp.]